MAFFIKSVIMQRSIFYIDGFNFYFGIRRARKINKEWSKCYWIDVVKLCESFLGENQHLEKVVYFTASPLSPEKNSRQSAFLNANKLTNGDRFEIVRGKYLEKNFECPFCHSNITKPEEKKTDVNISVRMLVDCMENKTDSIALVSADSDLIPPLEHIQRLFPEKNIRVYFPPTNYSHDIKNLLQHRRSKPVLMKNNLPRFVKSIMPDNVVGEGKVYSIPRKWKDLQ